MSDSVPSIGIDFGTTNSSMAWFDPRTRRAEVIKCQGEDKTPSMVFFGENETLVGKPVDELIEDVSNDRSQRQEVFRRTFTSIKRNLISPPRIALPGGRYIRPVEVVAQILKNLKREAQEGHFHEEVVRAVITCPAEFNVIQRRKIEEGGRLAGFEEVAIMEEPAAAALAYAGAGLEMGEHVLVYDLGGGTFDLAVLEKNEEETFRVAMEPKGIERCGGDDFDLALYYHCEEIVRERLGRPISLNGGVDLKFLRMCRRRKENLSWQERTRFSNYLSSENGLVRFEQEVERETFEGLIDPYVKETLILTRQMLEEAGSRGLEHETSVLIGGSTRVPVVERMLVETLPVAPLKFDKAEIAVALGAACYANMLWPSKPGPIPAPHPPESTPLEEYREAVEAVSGQRMSREQVNRLEDLAGRLGLGEEQKTGVEHRVLGASIEATFEHQLVLQRYREMVEEEWKDGKLSRAGADWLGALAEELGLEEEAAGIERETLGATREEVLFQQYREVVKAARNQFDALADELGLSREQTADIEREMLGETGRLDLEEAQVTRERDVGTSQTADTREIAGRDVERHDEEPEEVLQARFTLARTLTGHSKEVNSVAISPDGQLLASGDEEGTINLWNIRAGDLIHKEPIGHTSRVYSVAFSPDGSLLASGSSGGGVGLWDPRAGELLRALTRQSEEVRSVAFSPDGRLLANGDGKRISLWDPRTGESLRAFAGHSGWFSFGKVLSVAFGPDGRLLASGGRDGSIKLWEVETGELLDEFADDPSRAINSVAISPDGRTLVSGSENKIDVWDLQAGKLLSSSLNHFARFLSVAISPDGLLLFGGDADGKIEVCDLQTGELLDTLSGHSKAVNSVALSPDGTLLFSGGADMEVRIWERAENER